MSLNVENIKKVRDHLAALPPEQFDMSWWHTEQSCGTVCCIGGWTGAILAQNADLPDNHTAALLGIDSIQADDLFFMINANVNMRDRTIPEAVAVLDRLIETGEVDWDWAIANPAQIGSTPIPGNTPPMPGAATVEPSGAVAATSQKENA